MGGKRGGFNAPAWASSASSWAPYTQMALPWGRVVRSDRYPGGGREIQGESAGSICSASDLGGEGCCKSIPTMPRDHSPRRGWGWAAQIPRDHLHSGLWTTQPIPLLPPPVPHSQAMARPDGSPPRPKSKKPLREAGVTPPHRSPCSCFLRDGMCHTCLGVAVPLKGNFRGLLCELPKGSGTSEPTRARYRPS